MVRILIFNNNLEQAQLLCSLIAVYFKKVRHSYNIKAYTNAIEAEKHIRTDAKNDDIVFMDCTNLQKAAALIKRFRERNNAASWVYIGPDLGGLCRILLMRPSAYIPDLSDRRKILTIVQQLDLYHQHMHQKNDFTFKSEGEIVRVPYASISYFESNAKKVTLHISNSTKVYHFAAKLDDIEAMVPGFFLRCHQSYLVNMQMIRHLDSKSHSFIMHSTDEVFISRRTYAAAKEAYESFLQGKQDYTSLAE